jgi:hypothetical protein
MRQKQDHTIRSLTDDSLFCPTFAGLTPVFRGQERTDSKQTYSILSNGNVMDVKPVETIGIENLWRLVIMGNIRVRTLHTLPFKS